MLCFLSTRFFPIFSNHLVPLFLILITRALYMITSTSVHKWLQCCEVNYSRNFQLPFKFGIPTRDFCLLIWWRYCHSEAVGSRGDGLSGSRAFLLAGRGRAECDLQLDALKLDWEMEITFSVSGRRGDAVETTLNDLRHVFFLHTYTPTFPEHNIM